MASLLPYLAVRNAGSGVCATIVDNCAVLARLDKHASFKTADLDCEDCCPECVDEGPYRGDSVEDGLWWANQDGPGVADFLGLLVSSVELESSASARRRGEPGEDDLEFVPRTLEITGRLLSNSHAGTYFGETAYLELLSQTCGDCDFELEVLPFCAEEFSREEPIDDWEPDDLPDLIENEEACGPCDRQDPDWEPKRLPEPLYDPWDIDTGRRSLMRARFRSFDASEEQEDNPMPYCHGKSVRIVFEVVDDHEWGEGVAGCEFPLSTEFDRCRPPDWSKCLIVTEPEGCVDPDAEVTSADVETSRPPVVTDTGICTPLYSHSVACLTPPLSTTGNVGIGFDVWSGGKDLRNLSMQMWPASHNWPSPATCEGEALYNNKKPCSTLDISFVPASSLMSIDPRRGQVVVNCPGASEQQAEEFTGGWGFPVFDFSCRYWIKITADCFETAEDATLSLTYWPRWQS